MVDHLFVLPGDGVGEVLDWQASFTDYLAYREAEEQAVQVAAAQRAKASKPPPLPPPPSPSSPATDAAAPPPPPAKPLSNFERQQLERYEAQMETIGEQQAALQAKIDGFDAARNGYSELQEWTEQIEAWAAELEEVELKWLLLEERAAL